MAEDAPTDPWLPRAWRFVRGLALRFHEDGCFLYASSLTYASLLAIVPLLAIIFAIVRAFGGVQERLDELLAAITLDPGISRRIVDFVQQAQIGTLTGISTALLLGVAITLLGNVESAFNHIWRVPYGRPWWRKVSDYLSVFLITPFLLLAAMGTTSTLHEQSVLQWLGEIRLIDEVSTGLLRLLPFAFNVIACAVLYVVMPNRRPNFRALMIAAVVAGIFMQIVQAGYVRFQIGVARAEIFYGALAQIPVLMAWLYASWVVVLAGAEVGAVLELGFDEDAPGARRVASWAVALQLLVRAADHFRGDPAEVEPRAIAREMGLAQASVEEIATRLSDAGVIAKVAGAKPGYVLARDPSAIELSLLVALFDPSLSPSGADPRVAATVSRANLERQVGLRRFTLADVLDGELGDAPEVLHH